MSERPRFGISLGTRIFLGMAVVLVLAVGAAIAAVAARSSAVANGAVDQALQRSAAALDSSRQQYKRQLEQLAQTFADPYLVAYLAEGAGAADEASIVNVLAQRQNDLGFNFAVVLDPLGRVVARTDRRGAAGNDLSRRPLVARARDRGEAAVGVWPEEGALYNAVVMPLVTQFELVGYLIIGFKIDEIVAQDLAKTSGTEVAFLIAKPSGFEVLSSTLGAASGGELTAGVGKAGLDPGRLSGRDGRRLSLTLNGRPWNALLTPLFEVEGSDRPVGATMAVASLDRQLGPFRTLLRDLVLMGLLALGATMALSWALSRRLFGPVRRLVASVEAARGGDYGQRVAVEGRDEVGRLATGFNELLADLREKRDMESYLTDLSRNLPELGKAAPALEPTQARSATLIALELRRFARNAAQPEEALQRLNQDVRRATTILEARGGRLLALAGHRLLVLFDGEQRSIKAVAAAGDLLAALSSPQDAFDEAAEPLVALASGEVVTGAVAAERQGWTGIVGTPVQKLESLLREATPGEMVFTKEVQREVEANLSLSGVVPAAHRGVLTTLPFFTLKAPEAARLAGVPTPVSPSTRALMRAAISAELAPGKTLGSRFEILGQLGAGGMGMVFKARDRDLSDLVALKVLRREALQDPVQLERLKDELRLARRITHPNVLRTYDFGELDGIHFISMEYVRGVTLRYMLDQTRRLPFAAGLRVGKQLLSGLVAAHAQGVLHRDIKPDNLILDPAGNAKLMDFGIARPISRQGLGLTQEGWLVGTPQYMAPEQLKGGEVDARADLYATGVLLYEVFTGRLPFNGATPVEVASQHLNMPPPPPRESWPEIPPALEALLLRCLAKKPEERFASATELLATLDALVA
jgi:eukaryotic-like serine/threonine-protein kinase